MTLVGNWKKDISHFFYSANVHEYHSNLFINQRIFKARFPLSASEQ